MAGIKRAVKLKTISDVNRFLAKIVNEFNRDAIDATKASKLGYLCNILIGSIRDSELEKRISELEFKIENDIRKKS
jgi:hypothetical protein